MAVLKMGLQRQNEEERFTVLVSVTLTHCRVTRGRDVQSGYVLTKLHFQWVTQVDYFPQSRHTIFLGRVYKGDNNFYFVRKYE